MSTSTTTNNRDNNGQLRQNMQRALELEEQLSKLPKSSKSASHPQERASMIRTSLCEILSDILLTDPTFAVRKDCTGRLWRHCFYGRINELRGRIAKEKKKRTLKLSAEASSSSGGVEKYEKNLSMFLSEAIRLYQYLVNMYESKILCVPQSQSSPQTVPMGVIPGLHKMLIHLGDLHRYACDYKNAEASYREASLLAPSKGNPYNQLAVVAQIKEPTTPLSGVALYWYARALLAIDEPFDTARGNLARLFESNRTALHLSTDKKKSFADAASASLPTPTTASSKKKVTTMVSRQFLAKFVDVHYDFFQKANGATTNPQQQQELASSLSTKIQQQQEELQELLEATAFGDSLLCKMVTINSFSTHIVASPDAAKALATAAAATVGSSYNHSSDVVSIGMLAKVMTLQFGTCMAHKIQKSLSKVRNTTMSQSQKSNKQQQLSVRLLLPLLLTSDYVLTFENDDPTITMIDNDNNNSDNTNYQMSKQLYTTTACDFLKNICNVANLLLLLTNSETNSSKKKKNKVHVLQSVQQPKEYQELAGYRPFQPFVCSSGTSASGHSINNSATSKIKGGYVSMEEAAIVLELHASTSLSMTQESTTTTTTTAPKDENKIKIHRFLDAVDRFVGRTITTAGKIVRQDKGENQRGYVFHEAEAESGTTSQHEDNYDDGDEAMEDHVEAEEEVEEDDKDNHNDDVGIGFEEATSMEDVTPVVVTTTSEKQEESSTKKQKNDESTQSSSDVLVYKESKEKGGTPLLVPGDLLMNLTGKKNEQTPQETRASAVVEDRPTMIPQARTTTPGVVIPTDRAPSASPQPLSRPPSSSPSPAPPPGFGPPPGFAGGTTDVAGSDVGVGRLMPPQPQLGPSSSNFVSSMLPPGFPSHAPVQQQQQQGVPMMGGSQLLAPGAIPGPSNQHLPHQQQAFPPPPMPMFGYPGTVPQTANPFAVAPAAPQYMMAAGPPQGQLQQHQQQSQQLPPPPQQQQMGLMGVMPSTTSIDPYSTGLFGGPPPRDQSGSGEKDSGFMEGASLLDSSLLNTLYIDENNQHEKDDVNRGLPFSQNPFLK